MAGAFAGWIWPAGNETGALDNVVVGAAIGAVLGTLMGFCLSAAIALNGGVG